MRRILNNIFVKAMFIAVVTTTLAISTAYANTFKPVPMEKLQNLQLLHWNLSDEQLKQSYDVALEIAAPFAGLDRKLQLRHIATEIRRFTDTKVTYSTSAPHWLDAYGFFILKSASCQGDTCAMGLCLNILGIDYEHVNHNKWTHQWCRVNVDGTYWIVDSYGLYCGPEPAPYKHPKF